MLFLLWCWSGLTIDSEIVLILGDPYHAWERLTLKFQLLWLVWSLHMLNHAKARLRRCAWAQFSWTSASKYASSMNAWEWNLNAPFNRVEKRCLWFKAGVQCLLEICAEKRIQEQPDTTHTIIVTLIDQGAIEQCIQELKNYHYLKGYTWKR